MSNSEILTSRSDSLCFCAVCVCVYSRVICILCSKIFRSLWIVLFSISLYLYLFFFSCVREINPPSPNVYLPWLQRPSVKSESMWANVNCSRERRATYFFQAKFSTFSSEKQISPNQMVLAKIVDIKSDRNSFNGDSCWMLSRSFFVLFNGT